MCVHACVGVYLVRPNFTSPTKWGLQSWRGLKTWPWVQHSTAGGEPNAGAYGAAASHLGVQDLPKGLGGWPRRSNILLWRLPEEAGGVCLCVCLTEVAHLAGQLCNLIPLGENFFPISACDQILPWSIRLKCPCNFYLEERHTEESFSTSVRGRKNGENSEKTHGVVSLIAESLLPLKDWLEVRPFLDSPDLVQFYFQ